MTRADMQIPAPEVPSPKEAKDKPPD